MLTSMREAVSKGPWRWALIVLMWTLILSFGIFFGINDVFRGFSRERVAVVGSTDITAERFRAEFDLQRQALSRREARPVSIEQARAAGLQEQVLNGLITEAALDETVKRLSLGVSDATLLRLIIEDPRFGGASGFNRQIFNQFLSAINQSEAGYVTLQRANTLRQQILDGLTIAITPPSFYDELIHRFERARRSARYVTLPADRFAPAEAPSEEQLKTYYEIVGPAFRAPEYREAEILVLTPQALAARIEVSEADARARYDQNPARFGAPEQRRIAQLIFADQASAEAAARRLAEGTAFDALADELGQGAAQRDLGLMTRDQLLDPVVRDAAFALPAGGTSGAVQGRFGWVVLHVSGIEPASIPPFETVVERIRSELATDRARRQMFDTQDKIEEERITGQSVADTARKFGIELISVRSIDRRGMDDAGAPVVLPGGQALTDAIFAAAPGADNDVVQLRQIGAYAWIDLKRVTPARDRALDEVRARVIERWASEQRRAKLAAEARRLAERIKAGTSIDDLARELGLELQVAEGFGRGDQVPGLSAAAVQEIFRVANGAVGSAPAPNDTDEVLFVVSGVEVPPFDPLTASSVVGRIAEAYRAEITGAYVEKLGRELGRRVDERAVDRVLNPTGG